MMFTVKKNILQTIALLKAHGVDHVVISPGSRNAPLIQSFTQDSFFKCFSVVDERSAGFFAIGLINRLHRPVVVCCTSGTALMNYGSAVAEAFYQELPLVVISADRSSAWIGQMDGQTVPQHGIFGSLVKKSVQLPEINNEEELWHCNRLLNEALVACTFRNAGPIHINIPISEPLFDFSEKVLPSVRKIQATSANKIADISPYINQWNRSVKRLIVLGQMPRNEVMSGLLEQLVKKCNCVVLCEHLSNVNSPSFIGNFDALLFAADKDLTQALAPDLLVTIGGHIVSKNVKKFLRNNLPQNHWHISTSGECVDSFQCLTEWIDTDSIPFLEELIPMLESDNLEKNFSRVWLQASASIIQPNMELPFSDITVVGKFLKTIPENSTLMVGNSSSVRMIQLYPLSPSIDVFCNRGTNGIEGSISTACGLASISSDPTFLLLGDLSFFYDLNSLLLPYLSKNLRILLINNGGGGIFHLLPGLEKSDALDKFISANHTNSAEKWVNAAGITYLKASNSLELEKALSEFIGKDSDYPIVLEVITSTEINKSTYKEYYHSLKIQ